MSSLKLIYFDTKGRGEAIRLALHIGGIEFEDERLKPEEVAARKAKGEFTFGALPVLNVDGEMYAQSDAILRYAGKRSGLYPEDLQGAMRVDEVCNTLEDAFFALIKDNSKEGREKFLKECMPRYFGGMEKLYAKKDGPFLLGEVLSVADLKVYTSVLTFVSGYLDHFPTDIDVMLADYPNIKKMVTATAENKKVAEWEKDQ